eukprot:s1863_g9.t1
MKPSANSRRLLPMADAEGAVFEPIDFADLHELCEGGGSQVCMFISAAESFAAQLSEICVTWSFASKVAAVVFQTSKCLVVECDDPVAAALELGVRETKKVAANIDSQLQLLEEESVGDYVASFDSFQDLHQEILATDAVLEKMERLLGTFQSDLSTISDEIRMLQGDSLQMNLKLRGPRGIICHTSCARLQLWCSHALQLIGSAIGGPTPDLSFFCHMSEQRGYPAMDSALASSGLWAANAV